jgi:Arc/MetJ-type ribon-helix-helix transcriptional regulator
MTATITAKIPDQLAHMLNRVCKADERSKSYFIRKGLEVVLRKRLEEIGAYEEDVREVVEHIASGEEAISWNDQIVIR